MNPWIIWTRLPGRVKPFNCSARLHEWPGVQALTRPAHAALMASRHVRIATQRPNWRAAALRPPHRIRATPHHTPHARQSRRAGRRSPVSTGKSREHTPAPHDCCFNRTATGRPASRPVLPARPAATLGDGPAVVPG